MPAFHADGRTSVFKWFQAVDLLVHFRPVQDTVPVVVDHRHFDSFSVEFGVVGRSECFEAEFHSGVESESLLPVGFKVLNHCVAAAADGTSVVGLVSTAWVCFIEVNAVIINATNEKSGSERTGSAVLGEGLLEISEFLDQNVDWDCVCVGNSVYLRFHSGTGHKLACISNET